MAINGKSFDFTYTLPSAFASVLINDDWTGVDEKEEEMMMNVIANELQGCDIVDVSEESFFSKFHDAKPYGWLADDCCEFFCKEAQS